MLIKNCLAIGLSAGFIEPLESTSIHLVQSGIAKLMTLFPNRNFESADIERYNRTLANEYERIRDFIILHYHATDRNDTPFWDYVRTMTVPDLLQQKLDLFEANGRLFREADELFDTVSLSAVMIGQKSMPRGYDAVVDAMSEEEIRKRLASMRTTLENSVAVMPSHRVFIAENCASEDFAFRPTRATATAN